eukprot:355399-Chlamydomonas_euryale.AAC.2
MPVNGCATQPPGAHAEGLWVLCASMSTWTETLHTRVHAGTCAGAFQALPSTPVHSKHLAPTHRRVHAQVHSRRCRPAKPPELQLRTHAVAHSHMHMHRPSPPLPSKIDYSGLGIDLVMECTGCFLTRKTLQPYFDKGIKKVRVTCPPLCNALDGSGSVPPIGARCLCMCMLKSDGGCACSGAGGGVGAGQRR